jgi:hypothetical protein
MGWHAADERTAMETLVRAAIAEFDRTFDAVLEMGETSPWIGSIEGLNRNVALRRFSGQGFVDRFNWCDAQNRLIPGMSLRTAYLIHLSRLYRRTQMPSTERHQCESG